MADENKADVRYVNRPSLEPPPGYPHVVEVRGGRMIFIAGQAATNAEDVVIGGNDIEAQADQAFRNLLAALQSIGCGPQHLIKLTVFIRDMTKLADYRRARDRFFKTVNPPAAPAITLVKVSRLFSSELLIEIEGIAAS
jgi:enamine deaminase RidA (YjgF/YER057c/UK114 family)